MAIRLGFGQTAPLMETLTAALLTVLLQLPAAWFPDDHRPETGAEREKRLELIVREVVRESVPVHQETGWSVLRLSSLALVQAYNEGAMAYEVHAGVDWPGRPPPFGDNGRAKCLFQLQVSASSVPLAKWRPFEAHEHDALAGLGPEPTRRCVRAGVRALGWQIARCSNIQQAYRRGDHRWAATLVFTQNHRPRAACDGALSPGSTRRAAAYESFVARAHQQLRES